MLQKEKSAVAKFTYWARNVRSQELFKALRQYAKGDILDVGGRDFFLTAQRLNLSFQSWTNLEPSHVGLSIPSPVFKSVVGDGCHMTFSDAEFDTVLNIQVLEHVMEPLKMVSEIQRVLRPSGIAIFLIPQTSVLHELPAHYYNFTRYWIVQAMQQYQLDILELKPLGGVWSTMASHLVYLFLQAFRLPGYSNGDFSRNIYFYLLFPFMAIYALISIPICLLLSFGDLTEEPNNYLVVVRKATSTVQ